MKRIVLGLSLSVVLACGLLAASAMMPGHGTGIGIIGANSAYAKSVSINQKSIVVPIGGSKDLSLSGATAKQCKESKWSSSDTRVATVKRYSSKGLYRWRINGRKIGKCTVKATVSGKTLKCAVTVANSYKLNMRKTTLTIGNCTTLWMEEASAAQSKTIKWSVSNPDYAKLEQYYDEKRGTYCCKVSLLMPASVFVKAKFRGGTYKCVVYCTNEQGYGTPIELPNSTTLTYTKDATGEYRIENGGRTIFIRGGNGGVYGICDFEPDGDGPVIAIWRANANGDGPLSYRISDGRDMSVVCSGFAIEDTAQMHNWSNSYFFMSKSGCSNLMSQGVPLVVELYF